LWDLRRTSGMPLTVWYRVFCGNLIVAHLVKKFPVIEPCPRELVISICLGPVYSSSHFHTFFSDSQFNILLPWEVTLDKR
jgi:hypothetical protein